MLNISTLGWVHTLSSLPAIPAAILMFVRHGRIVPRSIPGGIYFISMLAGAITVYPIAHQPVSSGVATATLVFLLAGYGIGMLRSQPRVGRYVETVCLTLSAFLLAVPTLSETLRRLPPGHPVAPSLNAPVLQATQGGLLLLLVVGLTLQIIWLRRSGRDPQTRISD